MCTEHWGELLYQLGCLEVQCPWQLVDMLPDRVCYGVSRVHTSLRSTPLLKELHVLFSQVLPSSKSCSTSQYCRKNWVSLAASHTARGARHSHAVPFPHGRRHGPGWPLGHWDVPSWGRVKLWALVLFNASSLLFSCSNSVLELLRWTPGFPHRPSHPWMIVQSVFFKRKTIENYSGILMKSVFSESNIS